MKQFDSIHVDLDKWLFELNGEHMERVRELEFSIKKHVATVKLLRINLDGDEETVEIYESKAKPRRR